MTGKDEGGALPIVKSPRLVVPAIGPAIDFVGAKCVVIGPMFVPQILAVSAIRLRL
jgi:hypothetical protein